MKEIIFDNIRVKITNSVIKGAVRLRFENKAPRYLVRLSEEGLWFITTGELKSSELIEGVDMI